MGEFIRTVISIFQIDCDWKPLLKFLFICSPALWGTPHGCELLQYLWLAHSGSQSPVLHLWWYKGVLFQKRLPSMYLTTVSFFDKTEMFELLHCMCTAVLWWSDQICSWRKPTYHHCRQPATHRMKNWSITFHLTFKLFSFKLFLRVDWDPYLFFAGEMANFQGYSLGFLDWDQKELTLIPVTPVMHPS